MGFVRCGVFHTPTISESLKNVGMFTLQSNVIVGESTQALAYYSVQVRSGVGSCISRKAWSNAKVQMKAQEKKAVISHSDTCKPGPDPTPAMGKTLWKGRH